MWLSNKINGEYQPFYLTLFVTCPIMFIIGLFTNSVLLLLAYCTGMLLGSYEAARYARKYWNK